MNFLISIVHLNPDLLPRLVGGWVATDRILVAKKVNHSLVAQCSVSQPIAMERVYYQTQVAHWPLAGLGLTDNIWVRAMQGRLGTTSSGHLVFLAARESLDGEQASFKHPVMMAGRLVSQAEGRV